jgi:hypothetical protein
MPTWITGLGLKVWAILGAILAVLAALWKVYSAGKTAARVEGMEKQIKNVETRNNVESDVRRATPDDLSKRLSEWTRD